MAITAKVYKGGIILGQGTATAGSASITSYTANNSGGLANDVNRVCGHGRNVQILCTGGVSSNGDFRTRVVTDGTLLAVPTTTLTLAEKCPYT